MQRITLRQMNPVQAFTHYRDLVDARIYRAEVQRAHAWTAPKAIRHRVMADANKALDKATLWSTPCSWHVDRATKLRETYGVGVAAAFLRAHGWNMANARSVLF